MNIPPANLASSTWVASCILGMCLISLPRVWYFTCHLLKTGNPGEHEEDGEASRSKIPIHVGGVLPCSGIESRMCSLGTLEAGDGERFVRQQTKAPVSSGRTAGLRQRSQRSRDRARPKIAWRLTFPGCVANASPACGNAADREVRERALRG